MANTGLELRLLRVFQAVAEELHFRRAAARLHLAPSAVSDAVRELEARVGAELLRRNRRRVELTEAGRSLLADAADLLDRAQRATVRAREVARGLRGEVTLGVIGAATFEAAPRLLAALRAAEPALSVRLRELTGCQQMAALREGSLDVGLLRAEARLPGLASRPLLREAVVCLLPEAHRLARRGGSLAIAELEGDDVLNLSRESDPAGHDFYLGLYRAAGFEPRIVHEVSQVATILFLIASSGCVALGPAGWRVLRRDGVALRPLQPQTPLAETRLVWNPRRESPALRALLAAVPEAGFPLRPAPG